MIIVGLFFLIVTAAVYEPVRLFAWYLFDENVGGVGGVGGLCNLWIHFDNCGTIMAHYCATQHQELAAHTAFIVDFCLVLHHLHSFSCLCRLCRSWWSRCSLLCVIVVIIVAWLARKEIYGC